MFTYIFPFNIICVG